VTVPRHHLRDPALALDKEWLACNGLGGFASSTVIGCNTRRYHGLLIAPLLPPGRRVLLVSGIDDTARLGRAEYPLATAEYPGLMHPAGYQHLEAFTLDPLPTFRYRLGEVALDKTVFMVRGRNCTCVIYRVAEGDARVGLRLLPLLNFRDYHSQTHGAHPGFRQTQRTGAPHVVVVTDGLPLPLAMAATGGAYTAGPCWYREMEYRRERERGLASREDHFCPGAFEAEVAPGRPLALSFSLGDPPPDDPVAAQQAEEDRLAGLCRGRAARDPLRRALTQAADAFIVERRTPGGDAGRTLLAGYHWFADWGRDTMIALPGIALATGRAEEAGEILRTFAGAVRGGLIPNRFSEAGEGADYNTVDAPLWFVYAAWKYLRATGDAALLNDLRPALEAVIAGYRDGTDYGIGMDSDGLIVAGAPGLQLTWMDAKVGDWVVTPRQGKPVEISALWYNALRCMQDIAQRLDWPDDTSRLAEQVGRSFGKAFWNAEAGALYDVVGETPDASLRPNQILAASLPFAPLEGERAAAVVRVVGERLWTPYGLRSLGPGDRAYRGRYGGDQVERDSAYHQGTVWGWLMGPFISAHVRVKRGSRAARREADAMLQGMRDHLGDAGLGTISEIFEGDAPHRPRGCVSQAWSVGEVLRAYVEDVLGGDSQTQGAD